MALDARSQADRRDVHGVRSWPSFALGGVFALLVRTELIAPGPTIMSPRHLQPDVHPARRGDDLPVPHSGRAGDPGQFRAADHAGGQGRGLPAAEPAEPLSLVDGGRALPGHAGHRQPGHRLDLLHALQHDHAHGRRAGPAGRVHPGLQLDFHRAELHRLDPHPAAAGNDLVPPAACSFGRSTPRP